MASCVARAAPPGCGAPTGWDAAAATGGVHRAERVIQLGEHRVTTLRIRRIG